MSILSRALQLAFVALGLCLCFSGLASAQPISARVLAISVKTTNNVCRAGKPCELDVTVRNTSAKKPMTVLAWNNPLDRLADQLGVFEVRDSKGKVVDLSYIQVRRATPPPASDLVEIAPNSSINVKVALRTLSEAELPAGTKYTVTATGWWQAIWAETKQTVVANYLQDMSGSFGGDFSSNKAQVTIVSAPNNVLLTGS
ncbi:uncharacterized protein GIQ15_06374 [Arthroderma uncinatum]|uniref:uncharacterized protein n=1 Tax=Arthroderma uncinatum TaxID=74035 RepID=UPI00144ADDE3|nr:uncharacterized protein GIQ15_06374 [Arthroderma uncinatum]KAF3481027.1 hypothetical protein GIQ15_06374 [Arthroderma uncinatum]